MEVTVALVGDPQNAGHLSDEDTWKAIHYNERPQVTISVKDGETLSEVMTRATRHFGARRSDGHNFFATFIAFYEPPGYFWPQLRTLLELVDHDGQVKWNVPWHEVTIAQLHEAAEAGLVPGDASRWYLVLLTPMGNGVHVEWSDVVAAWFLFDRLLAWVANAHGASEAISKIVHRVRRRFVKELPEVLDRHAVNWADRGAAPPDFYRLLSMDQWDATRLTALLGCSIEDTEAILWSHGYVYDLSDGVWRKGRTQEATVLVHVARVIDHVDFALPEDKERLQARLLAILRSHARRFVDRDYPDQRPD